MMPLLQCKPFICQLVIVIFVQLSQFGCCDLVINYRNQGGELLQELISSNVSDDTVHLEFQQTDGTLVAQDIDFKSDIQIFSTHILGEVDLGESGHQSLCFITRFPKNEFISSDAMSKLRQKNPGTIRIPEEDRGEEEIHMNIGIKLDKASVISPHIPHICQLAPHSTLAREADLKLLSKVLPNKEFATLMSSTYEVTSSKSVPACNRTELSVEQACSCGLDVRVSWFPCALKYCKGKDTAGKLVSYRCGIKTCSKRRRFHYYVRHKSQCWWNDMG